MVCFLSAKCHKGHKVFEDGFFSDPQRCRSYAILTAKASVISFLFSSAEQPTFICLIIQGLTFAGNL